jgi:hypothetical protein
MVLITFKYATSLKNGIDRFVLLVQKHHFISFQSTKERVIIGEKLL